MMRTIHRKIHSGLAFAVVFALSTAAAAGQEQDNWARTTEITSAEHFQIPGVVLDPGTYVIGLQTTGDRHVVEFYNEDQSEMIKRVITVNEVQTEFADEATIEFEERPEGEPARLVNWFSPGYRTGLHFQYDEEEQAEALEEWRGAADADRPSDGGR